MYGFIYITTNLVNGKQYIGQHVSSTQNDDGYFGSGTLIKQAIKKYGKKSFLREILYVSFDQNDLDEKEKWFIEKYNAVDDPKFYNLALGPITSPKTPEIKQRISKARWSPEVKNKYSQSRKTKYAAGEFTMPKGNGGNKHFRHSDESKQKMRDSIAKKRKQIINERGHYLTETGKELSKQKRQEYWTEERKKEHCELLATKPKPRVEQAKKRYANLLEMLKVMSQREAAKILGVTPSAISVYLKKNGLTVEKPPV
jgi:group I intron endonuclease